MAVIKIDIGFHRSVFYRSIGTVLIVDHGKWMTASQLQRVLIGFRRTIVLCRNEVGSNGATRGHGNVIEPICNRKRQGCRTARKRSSQDSDVLCPGSILRMALYPFVLLWGPTALELSQKNWGSDVEIFEILPTVWNLKPIFTQKWASV